MNIVRIALISVGVLGFLLMTYLLFAPRPFYKDGFRSLQELKTYAQSYKELVPIDTDNTLRPVFDSFYKQHEETFFLKVKEKAKYLLSWLFLSRKPIFSASFFKTLIDKQGKERTKKSLVGNVVKKIKATPQSKFIVFGNIQGAFHSFVRDLEELKKQGIINDQLAIVKPDHYIIFMGDVVSRSPYSMETLAAVARVLEVNGDKVTYLRGNHESKNYWQKHSLKQELQIRARHVSEQTLPLEKEVNQFFKTLPLGLYIAVPGGDNQFIRVSDAGRRKSAVLQEHNFSKFLMAKDQTISTFVVKDIIEGDVGGENGIQIKAIIRGEKKRESFQKMEGLRFLAPDIDSVAWNVLSCPTFVYQKALKFYHDAFVILSAAQNIDSWLLTLHNRDSRTKEAFKATPYFLMTGINAQTKVQMERYRPKPKKGEKAKAKAPAKPKPASKPVPAVKPEQKPKPVAPAVKPKPVAPAVEPKSAPRPVPAVKPEQKPKPVAPVVKPKTKPVSKPGAKGALPPVSKKLIKQYLIEKTLTPDQTQEVFDEVLTEKQKAAITKKLAVPREASGKKSSSKSMYKQDAAKK